MRDAKVRSVDMIARMLDGERCPRAAHQRRECPIRMGDGLDCAQTGELIATFHGDGSRVAVRSPMSGASLRQRSRPGVYAKRSSALLGQPGSSGCHKMEAVRCILRVSRAAEIVILVVPR
jgi:hypothetical protein